MGKRGFTLIELIVVIAILSFLMASLTSALRASREHAKTLKCGSNIKELLLALTAYDIENGSLPYGFNEERNIGCPDGGYAGGLDYDRMGWWWFNYIGPYYNKTLNKMSVLNCPSKKLQSSKLKNNILCGNYGVNESICKGALGGTSRQEFVGLPLRMTETPELSGTLLIVDAGYALVNWWHATAQPPYPLRINFIQDTSYVPGLKINAERQFWPGQETDAISGRHLNKMANIGFVDGHLEKRKANDLLVEKIGAQYKNLSPLWSPR